MKTQKSFKSKKFIYRMLGLIVSFLLIISFFGFSQTTSKVSAASAIFENPHENYVIGKGGNCFFGSTNCFVKNSYHTGVDSYGSPEIKPVAPGIIAKIQRSTLCTKKPPYCEDHNMGNTVFIEHTLLNGIKIYSSYSHLDSISENLSVGQCVTKENIIGIMGGSGNGDPKAWETHLHLEFKILPVLGDPKTPNGYFGYIPPKIGKVKTTFPGDWGYLNPQDYIGKQSAEDCSVPPPPSGNYWTSSADLNEIRIGGYSFLLQNGKVLVFGGSNGSGLSATAEIFDPIVNDGYGSWTSISGMITSRTSPGATMLNDGRILVVGGYDQTGTVLSSAEIFDPNGGSDGNGSWSIAPSMMNIRQGMGIVTLADGRVLVAGGQAQADHSYLSSAEIFDPNGGSDGKGSWSNAGDLSVARHGVQLALLKDGRVLASGGWNYYLGGSISTSEIFSPNDGNWIVTGNMNHIRTDHTLTTLQNGKVLAIGGKSTQISWDSELFDPLGDNGKGSWSDIIAYDLPDAMAFDHTATLLQDGRVLVTGFTINTPSTHVEVFDPTAGVWITVADMAVARKDAAATILQNGQVLVAGGRLWSDYYRSSEIYTP